MHWYILGAGAIGRLWACLFEHSALPATLLLRNRAALEHWQHSGPIELLEAHRKQYCTLRAEILTDSSPIDYLLVTTKAYDTLTALQLLPDCRFWAATTTAGAWREPPNRLHCISRGETLIGALTADTPELPTGWDRLPLPLTPCGDMLSALWRKLAINCAINPLTAVEGCRNGELLQHPDRRQQLRQVCAEVEQVAQAAGITLFEIPLHRQAEAVALATGDNLSSMLQDVRHNRPTEIEQITGYLCNRAKELGVATPLNTRLLQQVRALTMAREPQDD